MPYRVVKQLKPAPTSSVDRNGNSMNDPAWASRNIWVAKLSGSNEGENIFIKAIKAPYKTILSNAGIETNEEFVEGNGINVVTGEEVDMVKSGIIDPVLVTKTALKNSISVVTTIISADCVISNIRINEGS